MKNLDTVYSLIHSMDKSEKRHFKISISKYAKSRDKNTVQLFDLLNKMPEFNEEVLKSKWKKNSNKNNLAYDKHQLQTQLLDFLVQYHRNKDVFSQMGNLLSQVEILKGKKQFSLAKKLIEKGLNIAKRNNSFQFSSLFQSKKITISNYDYHINYQKSIEGVETFDEIIEEQYIISKYFVLYRKMGLIFTFEIAGVEAEKALEEIANSPFFIDESKAVSFLAKIYLYDLKSMYYQQKKQSKKSLAYQEKMQELYIENPKQKEKNRMGYIGQCFNLIISLNNAGYHEKSLTYLKRIEVNYGGLGELLTDLEKNYFDDNFVLLCVMTFYYLERFEEATDFIEERKEELENLFIANEGHRLHFYMYSAACYFVQENYTELYKFQKLLEENPEGIYYSNHFFMKIFCFLADYEKNVGPTFLDSQFRKLYYLSRKHEEINQHPFNKQMLSMLRQLTKAPHPKETQQIYKETLTKIEGPSKIDNLSINSFVAICFWLRKKTNSNFNNPNSAKGSSSIPS